MFYFTRAALILLVIILQCTNAWTSLRINCRKIAPLQKVTQIHLAPTSDGLLMPQPDEKSSKKASRSYLPKRACLGISAAGLVALTLGPNAAHAATASLTSLIPVGDTGLVQSFLLILLSEIGDKTFFIAALLAAKYGRLISFTGSMGALFAMTVISTVIGQLFHAVPESITKGIPFDDYIACAAFAYFGIKTLMEAFQSSDGSTSGIEEEKAEAEDIVNEVSKSSKMNNALALILQTFSLVFAAEIGDRSFLSTIALSAALNPYAVATGALLAHGVATGVAVVGGAILSKYLSEKVIAYIGGTLFLIFAVTTAIGLF